jgi:hypothetical protein
MGLVTEKKRSKEEQAAFDKLLSELPRSGLATGEYKLGKAHGGKSRTGARSKGRGKGR